MNAPAVVLLAQAVRMAVPYACAGLGGVWSERSGVPNIALEGVLLWGGFAAVAAHLATGSAWAGVAAGMGTGAAIGCAHALLVEHGRVHAIVSGLAINLVAVGGTRFLLRALYDSSSNSPAVAGLRQTGLEGGLLVRTLVDPLAIVAAGLVAWSVWAMPRTRFGLRVRAAGDGPHAAISAGIDVSSLRVAAVALGCAICGLGGVALAYDQHCFQSNMSAGRGFIALAAVILAGWRPGRTVAACALFAALDALQITLQSGSNGRLSEAIQLLPYAATLAALGALSRRGTKVPAGLTRLSMD
ncbi:MAG TPA: ABC transporter permease [Polyangiaceae bacterium]|nr:ABC transporter permease [Polyangiaceae bacterium]